MPKVDIHGDYLHNYLGLTMYDCVQEQMPQLIKQQGIKNVKKIQMFDSYFLKDGSYPFIDAKNIYYPMTIIFRDNTFRLVWIEWDRASVPAEKINISPFAIKEKTQLRISDSAEQKYKRFVENKQLFYIRNPEIPQSRIHVIGPPATKGRVSQRFADVLATQIGEYIFQLTTHITDKNFKNWDIYIDDVAKVERENGVNYIEAKLSNPIASCVRLSVKWTEDYDICDYVDYEDIRFSLSDYHPTLKTSTISRIIEFLEKDFLKK